MHVVRATALHRASYAAAPLLRGGGELAGCDGAVGGPAEGAVGGVLTAVAIGQPATTKKTAGDNAQRTTRGLPGCLPARRRQRLLRTPAGSGRVSVSAANLSSAAAARHRRLSR